MKNIIILTSIAGIGIGLVSPNEAIAEDRKSYHAAQCQTTDGNETAFSRSEYRITRVGAAGGGNLLCPVVRDTFDCGFFGCVASTSATVKVHDNHFTQDVTCSLSARNETGSAAYYDSDKTNLAPGNDTLQMSVGWPSGNGTYALKCFMPTNGSDGFAKIYGYSIDEPS